MSRRIASLVPLTLLALSGLAFGQPVWFEGTGHYYDYVDGQTTWDEALLSAEGLTHAGLPGHLATITTPEENEFISTSFASGEAQFFAWIAGYEPEDDGVWLWGAGPELGIQFSLVESPTAPFYYANWGGVEPNDFNPGEDYAAINLGDEFAEVFPGQWIDSPNPNPSDPIHGMIVEYEQGTGVLLGGGSMSSRLFLSSPVVTPSPAIEGCTAVHFELAEECHVSVRIYDIRGRAVIGAAGSRCVGSVPSCLTLDWGCLSGGVYFVRVTARAEGDGARRESRTAKLVVLN